MLAFQTALKQTEKIFKAAHLSYGHGTSNARDEAWWIVAHAADLDPTQDHPIASITLSARQQQQLIKLRDQRIATRKPLAYLLGEAWLAGQRFIVDQRVIVPRSFISELIADTLDTFQLKPPARVLDLCTGSGCLAILLAQHYPNAQVDGVDLSKNALRVAEKNHRLHQLGQRVRFIHSDLFAALDQSYDLIVSNPPYVTGKAMRQLPTEYLHEPSMALTAGEDGLDLVHRILQQAKKYLKPSGFLVCELGHNRKALERAYPRLPLIWLDTSAGDGVVFALHREDLPG